MLQTTERFGSVKRHFALRRLARLFWLAASISAAVANDAAADVTLWKPDAPGAGWEVFTNGRIGLFGSYAKGDGTPQPDTYGDPVLMMPNPNVPCDPMTNPARTRRRCSIKRRAVV